jgi:hypothetical protein
MSTDITGFFNARTDTDQAAKSIFLGVEGETSDRIISDLPTFLETAGRDYGILRKPALVRDPFGGVDAQGNVCEAIREVDNQYHLSRTSDGRVVSPHTVTKQYAPLTLMDVATEIKPWLDAGWVTPDAVFSGKNESLELLCLRMDANGMLPNGEQWQHYIILRLPHAAGGKCKGQVVNFRPQCSNVYAAIGRGNEFTISHRISSKMDDAERQAAMLARVKMAKNAWKTAQDHIEVLARKVNAWSGKALTVTQAVNLTNTLLGIKSLDDASGVAKNKQEAILNGFDLPEFGTHGATLYDWVNAVTFYTSSPNSPVVAKSTVNPIDRMIRNVDPQGTGFKMEDAAQKLAARFLGGDFQ